MPTILTERTIEDATTVASRLHAAFSQVLDLPSIRDRRAATLATELGVGRMTCQRLMKLARTSSNPLPAEPRLLAELPGVNGLRQFLEAVVKSGSSRKQLTSAFAAVDAFEAFLRDISLSQSSFASALLLHDQASDPDRLRERRAALFDAASAVTGQSAEATISMMAIRPSQQEAFNIEQIAVRGYAGMRASGSAMPIRLPMNMAYSDYRNVTSHEAAREPHSLIESFCTRPLPTIDTRIIKAKNLAHIINPEHIPTGEPFDCFASQHTQWNIKDMGRLQAIWLYIDYPTCYGVFDLHVHRSIDSGNIASGDCHLWGTSLLAPPEDLWMTRFADQIRFRELGPGIDQTASTAYSRHQELTDHMFRQHGWEASEFTGYRCEMELPVWRSGLCIVLEER